MSDLVIHAGAGRAHWRGGTTPCAIGRAGAGEKRREGDGVTPMGRFRLLHLFWRPDRIGAPRGCALPVSAIRPGDGWSDDPEDRFYNRLTQHPHAHSHERMWRADGLYDLCAVIDWNIDPITAGAGSAIFLHCAASDYRSTEGCVAMASADLRAVITSWAAESRLVITA